MDSPICFSHYFVNKQNIRSFVNIVQWNLLKNVNDDSFLQHVLNDKLLVSALPVELSQVLCSIKTNLQKKVKDDFRQMFLGIKKPASLMPVNKKDVFDSCLIALHEILPRNFFGGKPNNLNIFKKLIHAVVFSMKRQHFILPKMIRKWDFDDLPWKSLTENLSKDILCRIMLWIIKNILSAMISLNFYVTTCKLDSDENKLHFFWKSQWQSYYDKKISNMLFTKILKKYDPCRRGGTTKSLSHSERTKLKMFKKEIPKLYLVLKPNNDCRPIVQYKNKQKSSEKFRMKDRLNFLKKISGEPGRKLETQFNSMYQHWVAKENPKLYFIKTDLANAFGSISREKLMKILCERHMNFQKTEKNMYMKQKVAQQYKEMIAELRKPLLVRAGVTIFEWTEGLVQGYKYSPALSELYYTHLDELYLNRHLNKTEEPHVKLFIRVVDDYLYITDCLDDAHLFLAALSNYRNVNYDKTIINFDYENIKKSNEITFLGYSYNTETLQVSRASNVYVGQMCYKIAFSGAMDNLIKFLENRIGQSGIQISSHIFNLVHNTEELVWTHVFTTFCLSANKFCTILAMMCEETEMQIYLNIYKKIVAVKLTNAILETLYRNKPQEYFFVYCINHFKYLSYKALFLCAKSTPKCNKLVPSVKIEMAKCNCLFGKWKEHASRIKTTGELERKAIKDVCRRLDLRILIKKLNVLPTGIECYNHKLLL